MLSPRLFRLCMRVSSISVRAKSFDMSGKPSTMLKLSCIRFSPSSLFSSGSFVISGMSTIARSLTLLAILMRLSLFSAVNGKMVKPAVLFGTPMVMSEERSGFLRVSIAHKCSCGVHRGVYIEKLGWE